MPDLVGEYYQATRLADAKRLPRGQLCWAPALYLPSQLDVLALQHYDPRDERNNLYGVANGPSNLFRHTPVHELHLESDEELIVIKGKRRLVLVVSQAPSDWPLGGARLRERGFTCVPLYSFHDQDSPEFRVRVQALEYPWWVYLPKNDGHGRLEGFARLDRLQVIEERLLEPLQVALTSSALWYVSEWLRYYLTGEIDPLFLEYRAELLAQLP